MTTPAHDLSIVKTEALDELKNVTSAQQLEAWRIIYLGRKGKIPLLLRTIKDLPPADKKQLGSAANAMRSEIEARYQEVWQQYQTQRAQAEASSAEVKAGHLHPLTLAIRDLQTIFSELGFTLVEGPLVEDPQYNFDLLNIPPEHPARAETDTFYLTNGKILRTHVSPLQIRGPQEHHLKPPFKIFYYGPSFRAERTDATHEAMFFQYEFMSVSKAANLAQLKGVLKAVYSHFFGTEVEIRFNPSYFPFVEPGLEVHITCLFCKNKGCRICKHTGWIELAGAGMVHPNVLKNIGIDPGEYQGFALGGGIDRLTMLRHNINDIRLFLSGDIRFISKYS